MSHGRSNPFLRTPPVSFLKADARGVRLTIRVIPRAAKSAVAGIRDNALLVRLNAPPVDGAANEALVALLAERCGVPGRAIAIAHGAKGRLKTVTIEGVTADAVAKRLGVETPPT